MARPASVQGDELVRGGHCLPVKFKRGPPDGARGKAARPSRHMGDHGSADGGQACGSRRVHTAPERPGSYSLVASQVSLGEAAAVILRRGPGAERMLKGMIALLADCRIEPDRCMPPLDAGVLAAVNELVRLAPELDMTDRVILALADPDSAFFITKDQMILNDAGILQYEKESRIQGRRNTLLRIVNPTETYPAF